MVVEGCELDRVERCLPVDCETHDKLDLKRIPLISGLVVSLCLRPLRPLRPQRLLRLLKNR